MLFPNAASETIVQESNSMSHGKESSPEALDKGEVVEIIKVNSKNDIITYTKGKEKDYKKFGDYGDVIVFNKNGDNKGSSVIHRAVIWIEYNASGSNSDRNLKDYGSFDIPSLRLFNVTKLFISDYGYRKINLSLDLVIILKNFKDFNIIPHSGYLTKGDNNVQCDQLSSLTDSYGKPIEPVKLEWIRGKAERPWYENIFLIIGLIASIIIILVVVLIIYFKIRKRKKTDNSSKKIPRSKNESPHKKNIIKKSVKSISKKNKNISENSEKNG